MLARSSLHATRNMVGGGILPLQMRVQAPSFAGQSTDDQDASYQSSKPYYHQNDIQLRMQQAIKMQWRMAVKLGTQRYQRYNKKGNPGGPRMLKHKLLSHSRTYLPKKSPET